MNRLIKISVLVILVAFAVNASAQMFSLKAGLNLANMTAKDDNSTFSSDYDMKPGFNIGLNAEFGINDMLTFETGLFFSQKGFKYETTTGFSTNSITTDLGYLEIPLNIKGYLQAGGIKLFAHAGPYIGVGLLGKIKAEAKSNQTVVNTDIDVKWGTDSSEDDLKRFDAGLMLGAGVEFKKIQLGVSYSLGLVNISPNTSNGYKQTNKVLGINLGYKF